MGSSPQLFGENTIVVGRRKDVVVEGITTVSVFVIRVRSSTQETMIPFGAKQAAGKTRPCSWWGRNAVFVLVIVGVCRDRVRTPLWGNFHVSRILETSK
jgi:hypothetical protein